jgi:protein-tyrosine phosphatase
VATRELVWDGCINVRDLGGLPTEDGRVTRFGAVVRADSVRRLSDAGWQRLHDYDVTRIVDLRWHDELDEDPPRELGLEVVHVPVFPDLGDPAWREAEAGGDRGREYAWLLETGAERFGHAVSAVAGAGEGVAVVHCAAGKDRTGLVVGLLLRLVGVPLEAVTADYALSASALAPFIEPWIAEAPDERERARRVYLSTAHPGALEYALRELEGRHGSVESYLTDAGVGEQALDRIRERLLG